MKIDLAADPPADIFRHRKKHLWSAAILLLLVLAGCVLTAYGILSDTPHSETLETIALALIVVPALPFSYVGSKLNGYKRLSPSEENQLANLINTYPEIAAYCSKVATLGREITHGEFVACRELDEDRQHHQ